MHRERCAPPPGSAAAYRTSLLLLVLPWETQCRCLSLFNKDICSEKGRKPILCGKVSGRAGEHVENLWITRFAHPARSEEARTRWMRKYVTMREPCRWPHPPCIPRL